MVTARLQPKILQKHQIEMRNSVENLPKKSPKHSESSKQLKEN